MATSTEMMEMGFMIIYLIYILIIVITMIRRKSMLSSENRHAALRVLFGFSALLIGDIGHVGARLYILLSAEQNTVIDGIGSLLESIGVIILFIFWTDAWRLEFSHSKQIIYYILILTGILG